MAQQHQQTVLDFLIASTAYHNSGLTIEWGDRQGILHLRDGCIVAAEAEPLSGNGAAMEIARWQGFTISESEAEPVIRKNVTLTLHEMQDIFQRLSITGNHAAAFDDLDYLDQAILLIHQFRYAEAGKLLAELLRHNRFNYLGWLWYSRLLKKLDSIKKALAEAQRWGDHDPTVWLEVKKTGVGMANNPGHELKRCLYCWTPLASHAEQCCHCRAWQTIGTHKPAPDLKKAEIVNGINRYINGFKVDKKNSKAGYVLALGFFNLKQFDKSYKYLKFITSLSPDKHLYHKALAAVNILLAAQPRTERTASGQQRKHQEPSPGTGVVAAAARAVDILVIEDSPTARKVITVVLKREGFSVVEAGSGEAALALAQESNPQLILLDVMLPDTTGYDLLPQLRDYQHLREIPVIMLTGRKGSMDKIKGLQAGSTEYLTKPFDPQKLTSAIKKYIQA